MMCPAYDNPLARFVITSWRDGEVHDAQVARDGDRATAIAVTMLIQMRPAQNGDKLDILEGQDDQLPEFSRASHSS